jgi:hypothetical protein
MPTVVEPLREEWRNAQAAALLLAREAEDLQGKPRDAKLKEARAEIERFHHRLCTLRVLDPACGSGNFLYVTLEHLKRIEGEVLNQLEALGAPGQGRQSKLGYEGETVTLEQLRGIELNERAASLAELVLWIGFLQWQIRTRTIDDVAEPVILDYGNIEWRDAVLAYDREEPDVDLATGKVRSRWDGRTFKKHPVTGEDVPDERAQWSCRCATSTRARRSGRARTSSWGTRRSSATSACATRLGTATSTRCVRHGRTSPRARTSSCTGGTTRRRSCERARSSASA